MRRTKVTLTQSQARSALWAAETALDQLTKFLRHDDWTHGLTKKEQHKMTAADREIERTIAVLNKAIKAAI